MRWPIGYVALDSVSEIRAPESVIEMLTTLGYAAVDWSFVQYDRLDRRSGFRELVERSRQAGLAVPQLVLADDFVTLDPAVWSSRIEHTLHAVDAAAEAGVPTIGLSTGPHGWNDAALRTDVDIEFEQAWDLAATALSRIVDHASATSVRIGLESVWGSLADNGEATQRLLDAIPGLAVTLDPSHLVLTDDDIPAWVERWSDRVVHVHLKDAFGRRGKSGQDFFFPLLGEGRVPWVRVFTALRDGGYEGFASVEAESYSLLDQCFPDDPAGPAALSLNLVNRLYTLADL